MMSLEKSMESEKRTVEKALDAIDSTRNSRLLMNLVPFERFLMQPDGSLHVFKS